MTTRDKETAEMVEIPEEFHHLRGCPATDNSRVEQYEQTAPGGAVVAITRCIECGAHYADKEA
jgi:hypothetical protein